MKKAKFRAFFILLAVAICVTALSVAAYADEAEGELSYSDLRELLATLTPEGNLSLVDDLVYTNVDADGNKTSKQFITVQAKNGAFFYIIIDRAGDSENVYFLNMVDEADLLALTGDIAETTPLVCTCTDRCYAGHVDTTCPLCAVNMTECTGRETAPQPTPTPDVPVEPETPEKQTVMGIALVAVLFVAVAGGTIYYVLKARGKAKPKASDNDFDEYDVDAEDEGEYAEFAPSEEESDSGGDESGA